MSAPYTYLYTTIYFKDKTYNYKEEVEEDLKKVTDYIVQLKMDLYSMVVMTEPKKFIGEQEMEEMDDAFGWLNRNYNNIMGELNDAIIEQYNLQILLEEWNSCHDEDEIAIEPPQNVRCKSFLTGDFVKTKNK